jgi:hypothetical protein
MATQSLADIGRVIIEPSPTFARLRDKASPWIPLIALIVLSFAMTYWWISTVDFDWLREHMAAARPELKPEQREAMGKFITPTSMLVGGAGGAVIGTLVLFALSALYYLIAGKAIGAPYSYGKWFAFSAWVSVPRLLVLPLMAVQIVSSHGHLAPEDLNMVSLNYLLLHLPQSHPWASLASNIDLASIRSIALAAFGLRAWTGRSMSTCAIVAILPYAVIYGLWAAKIAVLG